MNKKLQNGLVVAVSAAMGTGIVAPVIASAATTGTSLDAQYAEAYNATVKATASKDQKDLTAARVLVDGLYQAVKGTKNEYLATTLSSLLDPAQQVKLVALDGAIKTATATPTQANINAARVLILDMPTVWKNAFSSAIDTIQQTLLVNVNSAVVKAEGSADATDKAAAQTLVSDVLTVTNNADVLAWANAMQTRVNAIVTAPQVNSVSAINATQLQVTFSKAVKESDVTNDKFTLEGATVSGATLSADGKTATVTFDTVEVTDAALVVAPIMTAADATVTTAKYTQLLSFEDTVKPVIASVVSTTKDSVATELTVTASEPIANSLAKIDGTYYTVAFAGTNKATITGLNLDATKAHTLELINLTDKATTPNVTVSTSKTFNVTVDTVAPTVSLSTNSDKEILLTFSKSMKSTTVTDALAAINNVVKDETLNNVAYTVSAVADTNNTQFVIDVTDPLYATLTSRTLTVVLPATITDSLGNKFAAGTKTVVLTKDTVKPVATGYKIVRNSSNEVTSIEVNFSEGLKAAALGVTAAPSIVNMNGVDVTSTLLGGFTSAAVTAGDKKVVYNATTPAKLTGKYAFSFGSSLVSDLAETANKSAAFSYTMDFGNAVSTFSLPSNPTSASNVITVAFGRAVKGGAVANSATDVANYTLGGKPLPAGTNIVLNLAQDTATITLPAGTIDTTDVASVFTVSNIMSLAGETVNTKTSTLGVIDNVKPVLNSAVLNNDGTITIGFSEALAAAPAVTDLIVNENGTATTLTASTGSAIAGTGLNYGKYVLTVNNIKADATGVYIDVDGVAGRGATDVTLTSLTISTIATGTTTRDNSTINAGVGNTLTTGTTITIK